MMISETLELRVEGGRISHSCCMCEVSHGYGGLGHGLGWWMGCIPDKVKGLVACWEMPEHIPSAR